MSKMLLKSSTPWMCLTRNSEKQIIKNTGFGCQDWQQCLGDNWACHYALYHWAGKHADFNGLFCSFWGKKAVTKAGLLHERHNIRCVLCLIVQEDVAFLCTKHRSKWLFVTLAAKWKSIRVTNGSLINGTVQNSEGIMDSIIRPGQLM